MPGVSFKLGIVACGFQRTGVQEGRRSEQDMGSLLYFASRELR
jgi:hypothetical protein